MFFFKIRRKEKEIVSDLERVARGEQSRVNFIPDEPLSDLILSLNRVLEVFNKRIEQLEKQKDSMAAILSNMVEGVIAFDKDTKIVSFNPAAERILALDAKEVVKGRMLLETIRNNDLSELVNECLKKAITLSKEITLTWPLQKVFYISASPLFEKGSVIGCVAVVTDVTKIRQLEAVRRDFVANVSHELKTPLTSIKGFVETLLESAKDDSANREEFLMIIKEHADRLDNLVSDLLTLSSVESKRAELEKEPVNFHQLSEKVFSGFSSQLKKKRIKTENYLPRDLQVLADKAKITQVLINLIDNAIKFNKDDGKIRIYCEKEKSSLRFLIEDSGYGISEKDLSRIFERFYRVDKARSRELGGTGLGLAIVKHIIELHDGEVGVKSSEGQGSEFWFSLPA